MTDTEILKLLANTVALYGYPNDDGTANYYDSGCGCCADKFTFPKEAQERLEALRD